MALVLLPLLAFVITLGALFLLAPCAPRLGLLDHPGGRKRHLGAVPVVGGLAMFAGLVGAILASPPPDPSLRWLLLALLPLVLVGALDDRRGLSPLLRLAIQGGAVLVMGWGGGVVVRELGALASASPVELGGLALPFTLVAGVGAINAMNMSDGLDGLAGGHGLVVAVPLALVALAGGAQAQGLGLLMVAGCLSAFLVLNLGGRRRKVFMGDAGSMLIGLVLTWFLIDLTQGPQAPLPPVAALWLFGLPLLDAVTVILVRLACGRSPMRPDRLHFHYLLLDIGMRPGRVVGLLLALHAVLAGVGLAGRRLGLSEAELFHGFLLLLGLSLLIRLYLALPRRHTREGVAWLDSDPLPAAPDFASWERAASPPATAASKPLPRSWEPASRLRVSR